MRILVAAAARGRPEQYRKEIAAVLPGSLGDAEFLFDLHDEPDRWGPELARAEAVILTSRGMAASAIEAAPHLRFVQKLGMDASRVAIDACRRRRIPLSMLPDAGHVAVAEHTLAMASAMTRDLLATHAAIARKDNPRGLSLLRTSQTKRHVNWLGRPEADFPLCADLALGLVGFGEIAMEVARRARPLFGRLLYTKRSRLSAQAEHEFGVTYASLEDLLATADIVSLHATLGDGQPPILGAREFSAMRPGARFINTARGNQIDQAALVAALQCGHLRGAALDVFETEPAFDDALLQAPGVLLTPHTANLMPTGRRFRDALANIAAVRDGRAPLGLVS